MNNGNARPPIVISDVDKSELSKIARSAASKLPDVAEELMIELERAEVCESGRVPLGVVRMYSVVRFTTDRGSEHSVMLVYPEDADIIRDRLSILSPMGTALIGLSEGQVMHWTDRNSQSRWLKVIEVDNQPRD
ncbi:nucleoside diphosphate kinase regulator [Aestuariivirga litoralis]|uniref:Nucleoside diphosphate kinase regulator n=1 Tax=Aestuariivirga litoralis TaxID=2650924 RepID=A0A2W2BXE4_9HYPH|nr:nucleoside diphosphate kinase regulator [Aestuariivirga litoralis]PZF78126.1 nucleoside diphosphate kinase regulator [Aestuariivirga litoralis]